MPVPAASILAKMPRAARSSSDIADGADVAVPRSKSRLRGGMRRLSAAAGELPPRPGNQAGGDPRTGACVGNGAEPIEVAP
mmetsp:Transcript_100978/g.290466  ORF Transcript_100978/g.290466 Transcript_100978/m.290466 type:complete len:81 (-) Transcript_100978:449-691(-)